MLLNINAIDAHQKALPLPLGSIDRKKLVSGFVPLLPTFQSNTAGIPMAADMTINRMSVQEKPANAIPRPAVALPMAVASQIIALVLVASRPSLPGDKSKIALRFTAQYDASRRPSSILPEKNADNELEA